MKFPPISKGAAYGIVFLFFLSVALAGLSYTLSVSAVHRATASAASTTQLCMLGNESRLQQIALWTHLLSIARPPPHETPKQAEARALALRQFNAYVHTVFAPRNCQAIGSNP